MDYSPCPVLNSLCAMGLPKVDFCSHPCHSADAWKSFHPCSGNPRLCRLDVARPTLCRNDPVSAFIAAGRARLGRPGASTTEHVRPVAKPGCDLGKNHQPLFYRYPIDECTL